MSRIFFATTMLANLHSGCCWPGGGTGVEALSHARLCRWLSSLLVHSHGVVSVVVSLDVAILCQRSCALASHSCTGDDSYMCALLKSARHAYMLIAGSQAVN
jgi:hypothetical protein